MNIKIQYCSIAMFSKSNLRNSTDLNWSYFLNLKIWSSGWMYDLMDNCNNVNFFLTYIPRWNFNIDSHVYKIKIKHSRFKIYWIKFVKQNQICLKQIWLINYVNLKFIIWFKNSNIKYQWTHLLQSFIYHHPTCGNARSQNTILN